MHPPEYPTRAVAVTVSSSRSQRIVTAAFEITTRNVVITGTRVPAFALHAKARRSSAQQQDVAVDGPGEEAWVRGGRCSS